MPSRLTPLMDWPDEDIDRALMGSVQEYYTMLEYIAEKQRRQALKVAGSTVWPTRWAAVAAIALAVAAVASLAKP